MRTTTSQSRASEGSVHDRRAKDLTLAGRYIVDEVPDPYAEKPGDKVAVMRQVKGDPLGRLKAHHQIDEAQYQAGRCYQRDWEIAERGARAIDPTREAVDGGRLPEPLTDRQAKARKRLVRIHKLLGIKNIGVTRGVLIDGKNLELIALELFNRHGQNASRHCGRLFRDALDVLAVEYGLAGRS